jgi:protein-disulfide isomerase
MHTNKLTIFTFILAIVALVIALYSGIRSYTCYGCGNQDTFNVKVEEGIDAYVKKQQEAAAAAQAPAAPTEPVEVSVDNDPMKGDKNAPITMIEFSEYQCPYCKRYVDQTLDQIKEKYIDTGKVKYVFRDFPLGFHEHAKNAAIAAECAREQGGDDTYWEYHDVLFKNSPNLAVDQLKQYAVDLGLNASKFSSCLDSEKYANEIDADIADGSAAGVRGTPAFFINGRLVSGAQPYENFETIIEEELAK